MHRLGLTPSFAFLLAWTLARGTFAQPLPDRLRADETPPAAAVEGAEEEEPESVREVQPPLYLLDENDRLVPVPGIRLEDFERMLRDQGSERRQRPRYSLQSLRIIGAATEEHAALSVEIEVLLNDDDWVRVPLRFGEAVLRERAAYDGPPGTHVLEYLENEGGYVLWLRGESGETRRISMKLGAPLDRSSSESALTLSTPRATVSQIELRVPLAQAACRVTGEAVADPPRAEADGTTTLSARRLDGPFKLAWWDAARPLAEETPDLEATAALAARVDGRTIRTTANLTVRSFAGEFDRFLVRLPPGGNLTLLGALGYQVVEPPLQPTDPHRRMVEVRLDDKTTGPVEVRLETERPFDFDDAEPLELGGFEVQGAVRQSGFLALLVVGDWRVDFEPLEATVRQVENVPEPLRRDDLTAAFEFLRQPFSLQARIAPRETRLHVDPEYVYFVGAESVTLEARLRFTVRGARAFDVRVNLPGWELEDVGPASLVKVDDVVRGELAPLVIPLAKATTGQFELTLRARRALPAAPADLTVELPAPVSDTSSPAAVVVLPDDNVELRPQADAMLGLNRQRVAPTMNLPPRQQEPLFYRADEPAASFAAQWIVHERQIAVDVASEATWDEQESRVEQRFSYRVAYEPVSTLLLDLPAALAEEPKLEVLLDGRAAPLRAQAGEPAPPGRIGRYVELPSERIGAIDLVLRYPLPPLALVAEGPTPWTVPLVLPAEGTLGTHELRVRATGGASIAANDAAWKTATTENGEPALGSERRLTATELVPQAVVQLVAAERRTDGDATVVDRAWIQSWLTADGRQDRAAFRFLTDRTHIAVRLPQGVLATGLTVRLDGRPAPLDGPPRRTLVLAIPPGRQGRLHTLELQYRFAERDSRNGVLVLTAPQMPDDAWLQRLYWQVALPPDEHALQAPAGFTGEQQWAFGGLGWQRQPLRDQRDLEAWVGAESRAELPSGTNVFLFGALGDRPALELRTASRSVLVFAASLAALATGLLVMYAPPRGRRLAAFAALGAIAALAAMYPEAAVLLLQAAALGLALAAVAMTMERLLSGRRRPAVRRATSSIVERRSTEARARPPLVSPASTMSAAVEEVPSPEVAP